MLELGKKIVNELGLVQSVDTLGRWMAHYVAELIEEAKNAKAEDRPVKLAACREAIFDLWQYRHELPNGKRPFEEFEPIFRTLESLDPADDTPRYFRSPRVAANDAEHDAETTKWLQLADGFDYSARVLIRYCLAHAAQSALDKSRAWVALAEAAGAEEGIDFSVIRFITDETDLLKSENPDDRTRKELKNRIERLDAFKKMATALASDLKRQLKQIGSSKGAS